VLSGRGLCDRLITRPEEAYRVCVFVLLSSSATLTLYNYNELVGKSISE